MELSRMSWAQAREAIQKAGVALLPVGSTEQHGPHLPLGTDWLTAQEIARRAGKKGGWLVLPTVPVGVSEHHRQFWGTLWVPPEVLRDYVMGVARSLAFHGLRRLVFVNGHGGNTAALEEAARRLRLEGIYAFVYVWWRAIPETIAQVIESGGSHAAEMETAVVLAIAPELVRRENYGEAVAKGAPEWGKKVEGVDVGFDTVDFSQSGATGDPARATVEKGERILQAAAERLDAFCRWLAAQPEEALAPKPHLP
ncbi:creatininase family protein [Candidatus Bipolaricaulota bacterium]|nr:creatininase family protein [Candidatus Bipolaricaulota bacterium]